MPANGLRVNHHDFLALHSMWIKLSTSSKVPENDNDLPSNISSLPNFLGFHIGSFCFTDENSV